MGLPSLQLVVQGQPGTGLKQRAAAKKRAHAAVASQVPLHEDTRDVRSVAVLQTIEKLSTAGNASLTFCAAKLVQTM